MSTDSSPSVDRKRGLHEEQGGEAPVEEEGKGSAAERPVLDVPGILKTQWNIILKCPTNSTSVSKLSESLVVDEIFNEARTLRDFVKQIGSF